MNPHQTPDVTIISYTVGEGQSLRAIKNLLIANKWQGLGQACSKVTVTKTMAYRNKILSDALKTSPLVLRHFYNVITHKNLR